MGLNYGLLRNLAAREIVSALVRDGFAYDRGDGSHQIYLSSRRPQSDRGVSRGQRHFQAEDSEEHDRPDPMDGSRSQTSQTHLLICRFAATDPPGLY